MRLPTETEYVQMLGRLKDVMDFASEELEQLANGVRPGMSDVAVENITTRLRKLALNVTFKVGNDENDPVPAGLPTLTNTPTPNVPV